MTEDGIIDVIAPYIKSDDPDAEEKARLMVEILLSVGNLHNVRQHLRSRSSGARLDIGDDTISVVSTSELIEGGAAPDMGGVVSASEGPTPSITKNDSSNGKNKNVSDRDPSEVKGLGVSHEWDALKAIVVGRTENDVFAPQPWQPEVDGLPKKGGISYRDFNPHMWNRAVRQLDNLVDLLEREGVDVYRPPLVSPDEAMSFPVGLTQMYARESFSVISDYVVINQCRTPYRRKESRAIAPFLQRIMESTNGGSTARILQLPPVPDDIEDSLPDDPNPYLEGGDLYKLGNDVLVTISGLATSPAGYRWLADTLDPLGITTHVGYIDEEYEHGDYILMLVREGLCIAYLNGFVDKVLPTPIMDWDVVELTHADTDPGTAANGIVLRPGVIILPEGNRRVRRALERKGVDVIEIPFDGVSYFGGSIRCATSSLWREDADA